MGNTDVVDMLNVQCLVGHVPCGRNQWAIIDQSGTLVHAEAQVQDFDNYGSDNPW